VTDLGKVFDEMFGRDAGATRPAKLLEGAEDEIDKLFGD
jgi:hypothetical protein